MHAQTRVGELTDPRGSEAAEDSSSHVGVCVFCFRSGCLMAPVGAKSIPNSEGVSHPSRLHILCGFKISTPDVSMLVRLVFVPATPRGRWLASHHPSSALPMGDP